MVSTVPAQESYNSNGVVAFNTMNWDLGYRLMDTNDRDAKNEKIEMSNPDE